MSNPMRDENLVPSGMTMVSPTELSLWTLLTAADVSPEQFDPCRPKSWF